MALADQFVRRWRLLRVLESEEGQTAEELLERLAGEEDGGNARRWSLRTLQRDLSHLLRAGFPLEGVRKDRKMRYRLVSAYLASVPGPFRPSEWAAVYFALAFLREAPGSPLREEPLRGCLSGVFARLRGVVPEGLRAFAEGVEPRYAGVVGALREQDRMRRVGEALVEAIAEKRPVRVLAAKPGEMRRRWFRLDPYFLGYREGGYHLLGRESEHDGIEAWPLQGIESVRPGRGAFQLPLGLDLEAALAERLREARGAGWRVRLKFRKGVAAQAVADYLGEAFGPARVVRGPRGGGSEVTVQASDLWGLRRWVLAFGPEAEVVSPQEFRLSVAQDLESALDRYRSTGRVPEGDEPV